MTIGERIAVALTRAGKTKAQLARYLGTKDSTVGGWINAGRVPYSDVVMPICEFTGVSVDWLLSGEDAPDDGRLPKPELALLHAFRGLSPVGQSTALNQVTSLLEMFPAEESQNKKTQTGT